ncbi:hypothetical protein [Chryseobacterium indoltheticum]
MSNSASTVPFSLFKTPFTPSKDAPENSPRLGKINSKPTLPKLT